MDVHDLLDRVRTESTKELNESGLLKFCIDAARQGRLDWGSTMLLMLEFRKRMLWSGRGEPLDCAPAAAALEQPDTDNDSDKRLCIAIVLVLNGHDAPLSDTDARFDWQHFLHQMPRVNAEGRYLNRLARDVDLRL